MSPDQNLAAFAIALFALGVLAWAGSPLLERMAGDRGAQGALWGGMVLLLGSAFVAQATPASWLLVYAPSSVLAWGATVYVAFLSGTPVAAPAAETTSAHCVSRLIHGTREHIPFYHSGLRTRLSAYFTATPSDCCLDVEGKGSARAYYGLFYSTHKDKITPRVAVVCAKTGSGCRITPDVKGRSEITVSPLLLRVDFTPTVVGDMLTVRVSVAGAATAAGGSLGVSAGAGGSVGLPNSATGFRDELGTFVWQCMRS